MRPKQGLIKQAGNALKKASPTILSCLGAIGVVATTVLAVKATPKVMELAKADSRKNHDGNPNAATKVEVVKSCWKCYIPAAVTGAATITCIFGANVLNRRQQASITSAYALVSRSYTDYKRKVKELYGEEAHKKVMESLAAEKVDKDHVITSPGIMGSSCLDFEDADEEERLFYDSFSGRYFTSTIGKVLQAEYHLNRNFALNGGGIALNHFYDLLGIGDIPEGDTIGWFANDEMYWIDFDHSKAILEDGLECYIIDMVTQDNGLAWHRPESPYIVGMFHDLCKADLYRHPEVAPPIMADGHELHAVDVTKWEHNPDTLLKGHGDKSVMLLSQYFQLTLEEILCIRYHMGAFVDQKEWNDYTRAIHQFDTVLWTHHADMIASHILE